MGDEMGLGEIARENRRLEEEARDAVPVACPFHFDALEIRDDVRSCPMGDYRWTPGLGGVDLTGPGVEAYVGGSF